jgi:hypothetical protein
MKSFCFYLFKYISNWSCLIGVELSRHIMPLQHSQMTSIKFKNILVISNNQGTNLIETNKNHQKIYLFTTTFSLLYKKKKVIFFILFIRNFNQFLNILNV